MLCAEAKALKHDYNLSFFYVFRRTLRGLYIFNEIFNHNEFERVLKKQKTEKNDTCSLIVCF